VKGSHNLKSTLKEMENFIFEMNTMNSQHLNTTKIKNYLEMVRKEKGQQAAEDLGNHLLTVKTEYLIMVSLYYTHIGDQARVTQEWEDFNRDVKEVIKYGGLADLYEGDEVDGLKHGKGTMYYRGGGRDEGDWVQGMDK
jgi:hypothetical protein